MTTEELLNSVPRLDGTSTPLSSDQKKIVRQNVLDALYKFSRGQCMNKERIRLFNPLTGHFEYKEVPCNYCEVCRSKMQNDWYVRMAEHSQEYPYVYYCTFTFASPETADTVGCNYVRFPLAFGGYYTKRLQVGKHHKVALYHMHSLIGSVFSRNLMNTNRQVKELPAYVPQKAMQNMWKKLRSLLAQAYKNSDTVPEVSYYSCYEMGHTYGHCHMHAIVWSNVPIGYGTFQNAWSRKYVGINGEIVPFRGQKKDITTKPFLTSFGHVDYVDLYANGTMSNGGKDKSGKLVFGYVCKYLQKAEFNDIQIRDAFGLLPKYEVKPNLFDQYLSELSKPVVKSIQLTLFEQDVPPASKVVLDSVRVYQNVPYTYEEFKKLCRPYTRCSTRRAIGRDYADRHFDDISKGNFKVSPSAGGDSLAMPSYFISLTKQRLLPFRNPLSSHGTPTRSLGSLQVNICNLEVLADWNDPEGFSYPNKALAFYTVRQQPCCFDDEGNYVRRSGLLTEHVRCLIRELTFYDVVNNCHYTLEFHEGRLKYKLSKFNRKLRKFEVQGFVEIRDFLEVYKASVDEYACFTLKLTSETEKRQYYWNEFRSRLDRCGISFGHLKEDVERMNQARIAARQLLYHADHFTACES